MPIGIQTFADIIHGGYLYVDKTRHIYDMIHQAKGVYFLARPRRFGKSLLISTLAEIFAGNRELFQGLWLYDSPYTWSQHPVIRLDFSRGQVASAVELEEYIHSALSGTHCPSLQHPIYGRLPTSLQPFLSLPVFEAAALCQLLV